MDREVKSVDAVLQDHENRITKLEREYVNINHKLTSLETGVVKIENTVMTEGKEQRKLLNKMIESQFGLDNQKLTSSEKVKVAFISTLGTILGGGAVVGIVGLFMK